MDRKYQNYFNLGLIGMAVTSPEKEWLEVNEKLCEILGFPQDELVKLSWAEITHPDDLKADVTKFEQVLAAEIDAYSLDKRFIRKDGQIVFASISVSCVRQEDGKIDHFVAFVQDITDRKNAEMKLQDLNTKLELEVANRTKELEETNKQLRISCDTDFLTKLSNRRFYEKHLDYNISSAKRNQACLSLLVIDIDNFKAFNDQNGHDTGDQALIEVARSIEGSLQRDTDLVARFGGEEFVVLLPETDASGALVIAERIRMSVEALAIKCSQSDIGVLTVSIGIDAMKGNTLNKIDLFKHADTALYGAKGKGKNCCHTYEAQS